MEKPPSVGIQVEFCSFVKTFIFCDFQTVQPVHTIVDICNGVLIMDLV